MKRIPKKIFKDLYRPAKSSRKGENGVLTIIGGSKKYHGAPLYAIMAASHFVDLVYFNTVPSNRKFLEGLKSRSAEFIAVCDREREKHIAQSDAVLIGPGLGIGDRAQSSVNRLMKRFPGKKFVLDADALKLFRFGFSRQFARNIVVTPHAEEFKFMFKCAPTAENVEKMCKNYGITVVLKGKKDIVCSPWTCYYNNVGNPGMTKGGTGDVLAGLIAALSCKNDIMLAATAGVLLNGLAAQDLKREHGPYFNATQLAERLPAALNKHLKK